MPDLVTSVSAEQVKERLEAFLKLAGPLSEITNNTIDDFLVKTLTTYKDQEWFVSLLVFVLNRVLSKQNPTPEDFKVALEQARVEFSNK